MITGAVGSVDAQGESGLAKFATNAIQSLREQEENIADSFYDGLRPDGQLLKVPEHITERFRVWEESFSSPEDLAKVAEVKQRVTTMLEGTADYVTSQIESKTKRVQLELAMKAVSKTTQGIQQLLSSQ
jgi:hypothetical protein